MDDYLLHFPSFGFSIAFAAVLYLVAECWFYKVPCTKKRKRFIRSVIIAVALAPTIAPGHGGSVLIITAVYVVPHLGSFDEFFFLCLLPIVLVGGMVYGLRNLTAS